VLRQAYPPFAGLSLPNSLCIIGAAERRICKQAVDNLVLRSADNHPPTFTLGADDGNYTAFANATGYGPPEPAFGDLHLLHSHSICSSSVTPALKPSRCNRGTDQERWDFWGRFMQPLIGTRPHQAVAGNHESETVRSASIFCPPADSLPRSQHGGDLKHIRNDSDRSAAQHAEFTSAVSCSKCAQQSLR